MKQMPIKMIMWRVVVIGRTMYNFISYLFIFPFRAENASSTKNDTGINIITLSLLTTIKYIKMHICLVNCRLVIKFISAHKVWGQAFLSRSSRTFMVINV